MEKSGINKGENDLMVVRAVWGSGGGLEMKALTKSMEAESEVLSEGSC